MARSGRLRTGDRPDPDLPHRLPSFLLIGTVRRSAALRRDRRICSSRRASRRDSWTRVRDQIVGAVLSAKNLCSLMLLMLPEARPGHDTVAPQMSGKGTRFFAVLRAGRMEKTGKIGYIYRGIREGNILVRCNSRR